MDMWERPVWQVAAGDTDRNYAEVLVRWDVIAMGPGRHKRWRGRQNVSRPPPIL